MKKLIICMSFGAIIYAKAQNFGFLEGHAGIGTFEDKNALVYGVGYHYINSKNIFSLKYTHLYHVTYGFLLSKETRITIDDIAAMYGRIWMLNERTMFTGSGGISYNSYRFTDYTPAEYELHTKEKTIGFPLDLSVRFFSKNISRSNSFGIKAAGTISKHSFASIGLSYGFGSKRNSGSD